MPVAGGSVFGDFNWSCVLERLVEELLVGFWCFNDAVLLCIWMCK